METAVQVLYVTYLLLLQQAGCIAKLEVVTLEVPRLKKCSFNRIYQFGDSLSDTGNFLIESRQSGVGYDCATLPYGINFFENKATGRCSDGLLIVDFIALESGLPLLNPYKDEDANFKHGVNFAVSGATALPAQVLMSYQIVERLTNSSLNVQLDWMSSHFKSTCSTDCPEYLNNSLFIVGEIGENDISFATGKSIQDLRNMVPQIVQTIINGVKKIIGFGGSQIVVPGNLPIGCFPRFLTQFQSSNSSAYDEYHCLKELNELAILHNEHLEGAIQELQKEHPSIAIVYGDHYNAFMWILQNAVNLGFDEKTMQKSCCGVGGDYNFDPFNHCGKLGVPACGEPTSYISWDGEHLTERAYSLVTTWLIHDILPKFNC